MNTEDKAGQRMMFAATAMHGLLSNPGVTGLSVDEAARKAVAVADRLAARLDETGEK